MYVAAQSFKSSNGIIYRMGDIIDTSTFDSFTSQEKAKCRKKKDDSDKLPESKPALGDMLGTGINGGIDDDFDTPW